MRKKTSYFFILVFSILLNSTSGLNAQNLNKQLHRAANSRSFEQLKSLLKQGAQINAQDETGKTALHISCLKSNNYQIVEYLIKHDADPNIKDKRGQTALLFAIRNNNIAAVKLLLENGAEKPEVHHVELAIEKINKEMVSLLVSKGVKLEKLNTNIAVKAGTYEILEYLLKKGANANFVDAESFTPLHFAARIKNNSKTINLLLKNGAKINTKANKEQNYRTAIDVAILEQNTANVKFLASKGAIINTENSLIPSVKNQNYELVEFLIQKGYNVNKIEESYTALHYAAGYSVDTINIEILKLLLANGALVRVYNYENKTPLHFAVEQNRSEAILLLRAQYNKEVSVIKKQNALMQSDLIIEDRIALDTNSFLKDDYNTYQKLISSLHFECENFGNIDFSALLLQKLLAGNPVAYADYEPYSSNLPTRISKEDITEKLGGGTEELYYEDIETGELQFQMIELEPNKTELSSVVFIDKWYFDEKNFKLSKEVKAYCPVRKYFGMDDYEDGVSRYKKAAYFIFDENSKEKLEAENRMELFKKIKYEFFLDNPEYEKLKNGDLGLEGVHFEKNNSPFWTSYAKKRFKEIILERVFTGLTDAYDFETGKIISVNKVLENLGAIDETMVIEDPEDPYGELIEITVEGEYHIEEIKSVIFIENWFIDKQTMRIKKEIVGVAPVRWYYPDEYYEEQDGQLKKTIAFVVYFNKQKPNDFDVKYISESVPLDTVALKPFVSSMFNRYAHYSFKNTDINFKQLFVNSINKNKVKLYSSPYLDNDFTNYRKEDYKQLTKKELLENLGFENDTLFSEDGEGGITHEVVVLDGYGTDSIATIFSNEIWKFDAKNFTFYKNVFSYAPSIKFYREDTDEYDKGLYKLIGFVLNNTDVNKFSQKPPKKMKLFKQVKYEYGYNSETMRNTDIPESEKEKPLFWNNYSHKKFKELVFDKIVNKKVDIYGFEHMIKLSVSEIDSLMVGDTVYIEDVETFELAEQPVNLSIDDFKSFIFYENWYINDRTLQIHKQVLGVAPVFYLLNYDEEIEEKYEKRVPFFIYFNDEK